MNSLIRLAEALTEAALGCPAKFNSVEAFVWPTYSVQCFGKLIAQCADCQTVIVPFLSQCDCTSLIFQ